MTVSVETSNQDVKMIANAIFSKNKLGFRHRWPYLKKQALHFSPSYRDFILKVIQNSSLKIINSYSYSYIEEDDDYIHPSFTRKRKNKIVVNIGDSDNLPHELGHAVDFWFGADISLSTTVMLDGNKTLYAVFAEEFEEKHNEIYDLVMEEYKSIIDSTIKEGAYQILKDNIDTYRELFSLIPDDKDKKLMRRRKTLQHTLDEVGFTEIYYQFVMKKCYQTLNMKYAPILDALSSKHDLKGYFLAQHGEGYYAYDKMNIVYEFFANLFATKVTSKHSHMDNLIKYFPRSFNAFEKLFVIFYDHLQNGKNFNDMKGRLIDPWNSEDL